MITTLPVVTYSSSFSLNCSHFLKIILRFSGWVLNRFEDRSQSVNFVTITEVLTELWYKTLQVRSLLSLCCWKGKFFTLVPSFIRETSCIWLHPIKSDQLFCLCSTHPSQMRHTFIRLFQIALRQSRLFFAARAFRCWEHAGKWS